MYTFLFQHIEYTATIQTSVVYSESRHVECGPAECDIAGRSVLPG